MNDIPPRQTGCADVIGFVLIGLFFCACGLALVWFGENVQVQNFQSAQEMKESIKVLESPKVLDENEGQVVSVTGTLSSEHLLEDHDFAAKLPGAMAAYRDVTMYQYDEVWKMQYDALGEATEEMLIGIQTIWSDTPIVCERPNPKMPLSSKYLRNTDVRVGEFSVPMALLGELHTQTTFVPETDFGQHKNDGTWKKIPGGFELDRGVLTKLDVGDLKVRYKILGPIVVTMIGRQKDDTLEYYETDSGVAFKIYQGPYNEARTKRAARKSFFLSRSLSLGLATMFLAVGMFLIPIKVKSFEGNLAKESMKHGYLSGPAVVLAVVSWQAQYYNGSLCLMAGLGAICLCLLALGAAKLTPSVIEWYQKKS